MFTLDAALQLIQSHGLWILAPFAVLEGPIVTVIAAYLARLGYMPIVGVYIVCVVGDLIGDAIWYGLGRAGPGILPERWQERLGITAARKTALEEHFAEKGGRTLLFGKLTHSAGMAIMVASGAARMNFAAYMGWNLLGTIPKTLLFVVIGYFIGHAYSMIDTYIYRISLLLLVVILAIAAYYLQRHWRKP
ncbi:MAG: VTT domain-containing protein [Paracoccaceae bacterium]